MAARGAATTEALRRQLSSSSADAIAQTLSEIRARTRLGAADLGDYGEARVPPADERLRLACELCTAGVVPRLWDAWELAQQRDLLMLRVLVYQVMAQLLRLLSVHQPNHAAAEDAIVGRLLDAATPWMARLQESITLCLRMRGTGGGNEVLVVLTALQLLAALAAFGRGKHAYAVWERFHWTQDLHRRLLSMHRRARRGEKRPVSMHDPDVRTQYLQFLLGLLAQSFHPSLKLALLDLGPEGLPAVLRNMLSDSPDVVRYVLLVLHDELFQDTHLARSAKAKFLHEKASQWLVALYARENEHVNTASVADLVHHFLLSISTHPGQGVCYVDRGWYGRDNNASHIHNHVLLTLLRQLRVTHDLRQQELALRLLRACPELVGPALSRLAFDIRGDSACLAQLAYVGRVLALPVPSVTSTAPPPPSTAVLAHTAPENVCRALAKAWRYDNALVQYYAGIVTASLLERVCAFQRAARMIARDTGERDTGMWTRALHALELAWRKRLPSVDVVYPLVQSDQALRRDAALRVLALYLEALPSMAFDTHWDAHRVLTGAFLDKPASAVHWERVSQVHALRVLLAAAPAVDLAAKVPVAWPGLDKRSLLHFLLAAYGHPDTHATVRAQCATVLRTFLHATALFSHDAYELDAWLVPLATEPQRRWDSAVVLAFLDECALRCLKTPYRYAERVRELAGMDGVLSPLLATITEQAHIRLQKRVWDASDAGRIVAYVERVCRQLLEQGKPVAPLVHVAERLAQGAQAASTPAVTASLCATLEAACRVPAQTDSLFDDVLASRPATYGELVAHVGDQWPGMLAVWLQRLAPTSPEAMALVTPTFDALDTWATTHELHADALQTYVIAHPSTQQWLTHASPQPFLARLVPWVSAVASDEKAAYLPCVAPLVDAIVARLTAAPSDPVWMACAARLAPYATGTHLAHMIASLPLATANDEQLQALAQMLEHGPTQSLSHRAWAPLYAQWPALVQQASRSVAARTLLDTLLAATLPAGTDPFVPPTHGSLAAWRVARQHATVAADWHALAEAGAYATLARALYLVPEAASSVQNVRAPWVLCALWEGGSAPMLSEAEQATLASQSLQDAAACVSLALARASAPHAYDAALTQALRTAAPHDLAPTAWLVAQCAPSVREVWLDTVLPFLTRRFAEDASDTVATLRLADATRLLVRKQVVPVHVAEPVLVAILHHRALEQIPVRLACALARAATPPLRASVADRLVNALLSRAEVVQAARAGPLRRALVALLLRLAQPGEALTSSTSLARVLYLYTGTLEPCDRALRALLERHGLSSALGAWKADAGSFPVPADVVREPVLTALLSLEPRRTYAACVHMPRTTESAKHPAEDAYTAYDPWFVFNLLAGAMLEREQQGSDARLTGLEWLAILRTGALGVVLCALSTHRAALRLSALQLLGKVYASLDATEFREKELALLVLERVRDCVPPPPATSVHGTYTDVPWLPTMPLLLAAHGLRALAAPHQPLFPVLFRFLLQRPLLDMSDVPLLYNLLHSTTNEAPAERAWMLRFLTDALYAHALVAEHPAKLALARAKVEGKAFKRRHVWELVLSLYGFVAGAQGVPHQETSAETRQAEQLESLIEAAMRIPYMAHEWVTRRGVLAWITTTISAAPPRSEARASFWLRLVRRICAPPALDQAAVLRRLAHMDARTDTGLVAALLLPVTHVWAAMPQLSQACVQETAFVLRVLLSYASLREAPWTHTESALAASLLHTLVRAAEPGPAVSDELLQCTLLLAALDPAQMLGALFASQPQWAGPPRPWALPAALGCAASSIMAGYVPPHVQALGAAAAGCEHLAQEDEASLHRLLQRYAAGLRWGRRLLDGKIRPQDGTEEAPASTDKRRKLDYPKCALCGMDLRRPFLCLTCAHAACLFRDPVREATLPITRGAGKAADGAEVGSSHIGIHLAEEAHPYACDIVHGTLFCASCDDVVYDARFEYVQRVERQRSSVRRASEAQIDATLCQDATSTQGLSLASVCRVPRGLRNMGSTCFLNVILQSFLHNPLLRNYFLSDRHNAKLCAAGRNCLACEMDKLFAEFFTRNDTPHPYGPTSFLYAIWMDSSSSELSRAGQHDAHEMFISALNGIHLSLTTHAHDRIKLPASPWDDASTLAQLSEHADAAGLNQPRPPDHDASCPCVVHRTFGGRLQSSVTCPMCKRVTHTREPFLDLSLEVRADAPADSRKKKESGKKRDKATPVPDAAVDTLQRCLVRYCAPEQLPEATYRCSYCQQSSKAIKQLTLHTLPPVLCVQLKRYEHALGGAKVDVKVRFPLMLDVRECCLRRSNEEEATDPMAYVYDLFTVVVHEGTLHSGHYTNFSRWHHRWYRFDDDKVTQASVAQVLDAKAYQLFYLRRRLWTQPSHGIHVEKMQSG